MAAGDTCYQRLFDEADPSVYPTGYDPPEGITRLSVAEQLADMAHRRANTPPNLCENLRNRTTDACACEGSTCRRLGPSPVADASRVFGIERPPRRSVPAPPTFPFSDVRNQSTPLDSYDQVIEA